MTMTNTINLDAQGVVYLGGKLTRPIKGYDSTPTIDVLEGLAAALRKRDDLDDAIQNMTRLLAEHVGA